MVFDKSKIKAPLKSLMENPPAEDSETEGTMAAQAAKQWVDGISAYMGDIYPPILAAGAPMVVAAEQALKTSLAAAFAATPPSLAATAASMETAFTTYGTALAGAITAGAVHTGTPPVPPVVGFLTVFTDLAAQDPPCTHDEAAASIANAIDGWASVGQSVLNAPPFTVMSWAQVEIPSEEE